MSGTNAINSDWIKWRNEEGDACHQVKQEIEMNAQSDRGKGNRWDPIGYVGRKRQRE